MLYCKMSFPFRPATLDKNSLATTRTPLNYNLIVTKYYYYYSIKCTCSLRFAGWASIK